jgi:16S rRNA (cytosine1402-N4)-methyltransferase
VKRFLQACARPALPRDLPLRASELPQALLRIVGKPVRPAHAETAANPRARSAVLRVAERTAAPYDPSLINRIEPDAWRS